MHKIKLLGNFEEGKSHDASMGSAVNMYPERNALTGEIAFYPTPGARVWADTGIGGNCTGMYEFNSALYAIVDSNLIHITAIGFATNRGALRGDWSNPTSIAFTDNGTTTPGQQLLFSTYDAAYIFSGSTFTRIDQWYNGTATAGLGTNVLTDSTYNFVTDLDCVIGTKVRNTTFGSENDTFVTAVTSSTLTCADSIWSGVAGETYELGEEGYPKGSSVEFHDGYFLATNDRTFTGNNNEIRWSESYEGRTWPSLSVGTAVRDNDPLLAVRAVGRNVYLLGSNSTEIWYDTGKIVNTFAPRHVMQVGLSHKKSIQKLGDGLIFIGRIPLGDKGLLDGALQVLIIKGAQHQVVSTPKIDNILNDQRYSPTNVTSGVYSLDGHIFYRINLTGARDSEGRAGGRTLVYDLTEKAWVEEVTEHSTGIPFRGNPLTLHTTFNTRYYYKGITSRDSSGVVATTTNSDIIYEIDSNTYGHLDLLTAEGIEQAIRRELVSVPINDQNDHIIRHKRVVLELHTGHKAAGIRGACTETSTNNLRCDYMHFTDDGIVDNTMTVHNITDGTSAGITTVTDNHQLVLASDIMVEGDKFTIDTGTDPDITLEWSDDAGATWVGPITATLGAAGDDGIKIVFNNLGVSRDRIYRIRGNDLANYVITDAYVYVAAYTRYK